MVLGVVAAALVVFGINANLGSVSGDDGYLLLLLGVILGVVATVLGAVAVYRLASAIDALSGARRSSEPALPKFRVDPAKRLHFADDED